MKEKTLFLGLFLLAVLIAPNVARAQWSTGDTPGIDLVMPFQTDTRHKLSQTYQGTFSHMKGTLNEYALDFASEGHVNSPVLAAHGGIVEVLGGAPDFDCSKVNPALAGIWDTDGGSGYGKRVYVHHDNGCRTHYTHLSKISVLDGQYIDQGGLLGLEGNTGCSTNVHVHFAMQCPNSSGYMIAVRPEPLAEYSDFGSRQLEYFGGEGYTYLPVGTLVRVAGRPEIYLVINDEEIMHISDWFTFTSHRFFYEPDRPMQRVVTISESAFGCRNIVGGNSSWAEYELVDCNGTQYVLFSEGGDTFVRHEVPFNPVVDLRYDPLLRSWGLDYSDLRDGTTNECSPSAPTGAALTMRPGTIVEESSDSNFWVITDDSYRGNDMDRWFPSVRAERMCRYVGCPEEPDEDDVPFMPLVFGSYDLVIMIPDDSLSSFVSSVSTSEYGVSEAQQCPASAGGLCIGGGVSGASSQPCNDTSQRACVNGTDYIYCEEVSVGVFEWSQAWPCGQGWECTNSEGQCTPIPYGCTPNSTVCYGTTHEATCTYNSETGLYDYAPSECGGGVRVRRP